MKVLLVLSNRKAHRASNTRLVAALRKSLPDLTWCTGTSIDLYRSMKSNSIYMSLADGDPKDHRASFRKIGAGEFDIAIVDQSMEKADQSVILYGADGLVNRVLDFQGNNRPSEIVAALNFLGTVCIGTSRDGVCTDELVSAGAISASPLRELIHNLPYLMREAERQVRDNTNDPNSGLKALTLRQPFPWSIFKCGKDVENRNWPARVRGTIAIHAAESQPPGIFDNAVDYIRKTMYRMGTKSLRVPAFDHLPQGAIVGLVDIVDCVTQSDSAWFEGPLGLVLANPRLLAKPVPCPGKRRFFVLPQNVERQVHAQLK